MKKQTLTLAILVCSLLLINTLFVLVVQISNSQKKVVEPSGNSIISTIIESATKQDPLLMFEPSVLDKYIPERDTTFSIVKKDKEEISYDDKEDKDAVQTTTFVRNKEVPVYDSVYDIDESYSGIAIVNGVEMVVDPTVYPEGVLPDEVKKPKTTSTAETSWVHLAYDRFDVYVEENYYNSNTPEIDEFFDLFEPRYEYMEEMTGFSAEKFYGKKLRINVTAITGCYGAPYGAGSGNVNLAFSDPLYMVGCQMSGGTGVLGNDWPYLGVAIHESLHAINPPEFLYRRWIDEGFSRYYEYNVPAHFGDISQTTADNYLYSDSNYYNWPDYVANDYRDNSPNHYEIQLSLGYEIGAWMYSMMRDDYSLDWGTFYTLFNSNLETLTKADSMWAESDYFPDMFLVEVFGRSIGDDFNSMKDVWEYDGPSGPGWGLRQWVRTDWYADLAPSFAFSKSNPTSGETVNVDAVVFNYGDTDATNVSVKFYKDTELLDEVFVDVSAGSSEPVSTSFSSGEGTFDVKVVVDEADLKIETDETNNEVVHEISFETNSAPVLEPFSEITTNELIGVVVIKPIASDPNGDDLTYTIDSDNFEWTGILFAWKPGPYDSGNYEFTVRASDGQLYDEQTVIVHVLNSCDKYDYNNECWDCLCDNYIKKESPGIVT